MPYWPLNTLRLYAIHQRSPLKKCEEEKSDNIVKL